MLAEDSLLLREGLVRLLDEAGATVVAAVGDGTALVAAVQEHRPDVAVVDVRMPPTFTDEGLRAALEVRRTVPGTAILVLSQYVEESYASDLLTAGGGVGYLLKDRVSKLADLSDALQRVVDGGTVLDPEVVSALFAHRRRRDPLAELSPREREVLGAHGRGPHQHRHRPHAGDQPGRGREAHLVDLHQARPAALGRRPPPRDGGADLAGRLGGLVFLTRITVGEPGAGPYAVAVDAEGVAWTTLVHSGQVARLPPGGSPDLHNLGNPAARPSLLALGSDGDVWLTRGGDDRIDRIASDGTRRSYPLPAGAGPYGIACGPDGGVWFTAIGADAVGRLAPDGAVTLTPVPDDSGMPAMITSGPDGALWFTLNRRAALGRVDPAGAVTLHPLPDPECGPVGIASDGDALWFAEIGAGRVGRLVPGEPLQEFDLPDRSARPHAVAPDGAGGCWVTLWAANALAHLDERGAVTAAHDLGEEAEPHGVAVAPDGAVLVALESGHVVTLRTPG